MDGGGGAVVVERRRPSGEEGEGMGSEHRFGAVGREQARVQMSERIGSGHEGPIFLGSVRMDERVAHLGDWSEILPWSPILEGHARDHSRWLRTNSDTIFDGIGEDGESNQST